MQTHHVDASGNFHSLDDIYYFGGQQAHDVRALQRHRSSSSFSFEKGDLLGIAGNEKNGQSVGIHRKTSIHGNFPSHKVEEEVIVADFPTYPDVVWCFWTLYDMNPMSKRGFFFLLATSCRLNYKSSYISLPGNSLGSTGTACIHLLTVLRRSILYWGHKEVYHIHIDVTSLALMHDRKVSFPDLSGSGTETICNW